MSAKERGEDKAGRVAWSETRNVAAEDPRQAARVMAATSSRSEELKQLAGVKAGGRALEKPVCHYSLSWGKDEKPNLQAMGRAVAESLEKMGLADRQAVMIAHRDTEHPHVHVVVNRVSVEDGRGGEAGKLLPQALPVGGGIRTGAGAYPLSAAGGEQRREGSWGVGPVCIHEARAVSPGAGPGIGDPPPA